MESILATRYTTTCKLCRRRVAEMDPLAIPLVGHPGRKAEELMKVLYKHLAKYHGEQFAEGAKLAQELPAFLILSAFDHEDPSMNPRLENIRAAIFQIVRKNSMSDDNLRYIVAGLGLDESDQAKVNEAFQALRDAVCEIGAFAPSVPQESRIIPV